MNSAIKKEASLLLNENITLTTANAGRIHDMLMCKDPKDRCSFLAAIRHVHIREERPFLSEAESRAQTLMLQHLPMMRLQEVSVWFFPPAIRNNDGIDLMLALKTSIPYLRHLHVESNNVPSWSKLVRACAANLESLSIYDLDSADSMPEFTNLKTLCYQGNYADIETLRPILALIANAPKLEALNTSYLLCHVALQKLLRQAGGKLRSLFINDYVVMHIIHDVHLRRIFANLTILKCLSRPEQSIMHNHIPSLGLRFPNLHTLEITSIDHRDLQSLIQFLVNQHYLPRLRYLRLKDVDMRRTFRETADAAVERLRKLCLERYINLATVNITRPFWSMDNKRQMLVKIF